MADQKTFAAGPSAQEWRDHKDIIIELYRSRSLHEVRAEMKRRYKFVATKRMYDTRFRHWKVSKVLKRAQKESMIRDISDNSNALGEGKPMVMISQKDLKKLVRHAQTEFRHARKQGFVRNTTELPDQDCSYYGIPGRQQPIENILEQIKEAENAVPIKKAESEDVNIPSPQLRTPSSSGEVTTDDGTMFSGDDIDETSFSGMLFGSPSSNSYSDISRPCSSLSLSPPLASTLDDLSREYALFSIRNFFSFSLNRFEGTPINDSILEVGSRPQTNVFWDNMKTYIYLLKISNTFTEGHDRIVEAWRKSSELMAGALSDHPFDFCREVLVVLSPTNVQDSTLRQQILSSLADHTATLFGTRDHPIPSLCEALCTTENSTNTFDFALELLLNLVGKKFGGADVASCKITTSIITSMRRGDQLELARFRAKVALQTARQFHGNDSDQARKLAVQLGHILTTLGDHDHALSLRFGVVEEPLRWPASSSALSSIATRYRTDKIAMHAMEDIAEYFVRFRNIQEGIIWLSRANAIAQSRFNDSVCSSHISDKLDNLLNGNLDGQVVDGKLVFVPWTSRVQGS